MAYRTETLTLKGQHFKAYLSYGDYLQNEELTIGDNSIPVNTDYFKPTKNIFTFKADEGFKLTNIHLSSFSPDMSNDFDVEDIDEKETTFSIDLTGQSDIEITVTTEEVQSPEPDPDPDPDPEPDPEPDPDPDPESRVFDEYDLIEAMGDEAPSIEVARAAIRAATDLIDTYTRGAAYRRIRLPRPGVNAVAHSVAARIAANPGFISRRDQAGNFSRSLGAGFNGFTLTEKTALNAYRRTAR